MKIYLAGSYSSKFGTVGIIINIIKAWIVARRLWGLGFTVLCPHTNAGLMGGKRIPEQRFIDGDLELLANCDALVLLKGWETSRGTIGEIRFAVEKYIPVFPETQLEFLKTAKIIDLSVICKLKRCGGLANNV